MISLFQPAANDQSIYYLGQIFGLVGTVIPVTNAPLLMGILFKILNTMALTIGAFLVIYVIIVGLLKTAQEGEFLGRQWNSIWVPIRTVLGIAALFPTATGYSAIQIVMMWIILQGVGAADVLWTNVLNYVAVMGSPYGSVNANNFPNISIQSTTQALFQGLMCQASAKATYPDIAMTSTASQSISYYCSNHSDDPFCKASVTDTQMLDPVNGPQAYNSSNQSAGRNVPSGYGVNRYDMGPGGACGTLQYCDAGTSASDPNAQCTDPTSDQCIMCQAQQVALQQVVPTLGAIASKLVRADHEYVQFYELGGVPSGSSTASTTDPATAASQLTVPTWIQNYCTAAGISPESCCVVAPPGSTTTCTSNFKNNFSDVNSSDIGNASDGLMAQLYLSYPLTDLLGQSNLNFVNTVVGQYTAALVGAAMTNIQNKMSGASLNSWQQTAQQNGWIMAGSYFQKIAGENAEASLTAPPFAVALPNPALTPGTKPENTMSQYRNNYSASTKLLSAIQQQAQTTASFTAPPGSSAITDGVNNAAVALVAAFVDDLSASGGIGGSHTNPLISIAKFGYILMIIAQLLFVVIVVLITILTAVAAIDPMVLGTGLTMSPWGEGIKAMMNFLGPFFVLLIGAMYSLGAVLGIYVPLIPYMIFTVGAIGWLLATVEAMVAAPIVALGILSPGGQHDLLGRSEPALMMIFNLFLRPSLMIIGMIASMFVVTAAVSLVNSSFLFVISQIISNPGLFEQILFISVYTSFIVTVVSKSFSLIYIVPERVLTWIGGPAVQYGEAEALNVAKQAVEGAASATTGAARESGGSVLHGVQSVKHARKAKEKRAADAALEKKNQAAAEGAKQPDEGEPGAPGK